MAEQSSAAVVVRAFVMLGCLVAIPLVAIFGNALPEVIDRAVGAWWTPEVPALSAGTEEAPLFEPPVGPGPPVSEAPQPLAASWPPEQPAESVAAGLAVCDSEGCRVLPATYELSMDSPPERHPAEEPPLLGNELSPVRTSHGPSESESPGQFHSICHRLKELGATYVLLESWGDGQEQFRFYCKIAIAGNPDYTYRFEATSVDPLAAMANVLRQVESWRAARYGN